ncbi:MAG: hypothetical protein ACKO2G_04840, partial [Verrucomicrobiales bacterium]
MLVRFVGRLEPGAGETSVELWISRGQRHEEEKIGNSGPMTQKADGTFSGEMRLRLDSSPALWSEFDPALHEARARLFTGDDMPVDEKTTTFGFREIRSSGGQWTLNGV